MIDEDVLQGLFDADWYLATYPDVEGSDPFAHFREIGLAEERDPNPVFSTAWYLSRYPDVAKSGRNALEDYLSEGSALNRDPGPLFHTKWYLAVNADVARAGMNPLVHYLAWGRREWRDPSPVFDSQWYFAAYPEAVTPGIDACTHYLLQGASLGYSPSSLFDTRWYLEHYPQVRDSGLNPLVHYLIIGASRGFDPGPQFSTTEYLERHPEAIASGRNPLVHLLENDPVRARTEVHPERDLARRLSNGVFVEAGAVIEAFRDLEPDLAALPPAIAAFRSIPIAPDACSIAWRALYLSLREPAESIVLVGSIDDAPEIARFASHASNTLIIETDRSDVSIGGGLHRGIEWRGLSEFGVALQYEDRVQIVSALVNSLQPQTVIVWGSLAGWELLARYGGALSRNAALFATATSAPEAAAPAILRDFLRRCVAVLSGLYLDDSPELRDLVVLDALPPRERAKCKDLAELLERGVCKFPVSAPI
jgi:hypothetical protein